METKPNHTKTQNPGKPTVALKPTGLITKQHFLPQQQNQDTSTTYQYFY